MHLPLSRPPPRHFFGSSSDWYKHNDWITFSEFERTNNRLAYYQAPINIANAAESKLYIKYNSDYMSLLETARQTTVKSNHFRLPDYPVPDRIELGRPKFAELVFHVFIICLGEGDNRIPSPIAWPNIFPAYPTLKLYQDDIRTLEYKSQYLSEASNPGITSLLVLPFLEMLKERRDDPLVILAVHMQTLCHVRGSPNIHHDSRWAWDGMVCTEEMEGFINGQEMREWFDCQPTGVKEECEVLVQEMGLVTRNVRMRNTLEKAGLLTP